MSALNTEAGISDRGPYVKVQHVGSAAISTIVIGDLCSVCLGKAPDPVDAVMCVDGYNVVRPFCPRERLSHEFEGCGGVLREDDCVLAGIGIKEVENGIAGSSGVFAR